MTDQVTYRLNYTAASDRGLVRNNNEDSAYAGPHLLVMADGMGGHAAGEVASQLMVEHLERLDRYPAENDMLALLGSFADDANAAIANTVRKRPETEGMGTTLTAVMFNGRELGLIHVGDSRGYRLRQGRLEQLTVDDTFVQSLVNQGKLNPEEVSSHPKKSLILKAYTGIPVTPSLSLVDAQPGDRLLLCSDGLSDPVTASTIEATLAEGSPDQAAQRLVELALRSGGPDNVTVVVADVVDEATLEDVDKQSLPTAPIMAGALAGDTGSATHPDTSAGRAAALRSSQVVPPNQARREPQAATMAPPESEDDDESGPRTARWVALTLVLTLILTSIGGGWWYYSRLDEQYFLDVASDGTFTVQQGADLQIFGKDLHKTAQYVCLDEEGVVQFIDANSPTAEKGCSRFELDDLPPSARSSVEATGPSSYDAMVQHVQTLAHAALPVCLTVLDSTKNPAGSPGGAAQPGVESKDTAGTRDLSQPGVNCREV